MNSAYPIIGLIEMNSGRIFTVKDVVFADSSNGCKNATVFYADAEPPLIGGRFPVRNTSLEFSYLEETLNKILSPEFYYILKKIEEGEIFLECVV